MLILTTNAFETGSTLSPLPSWPGLHVLIVLPGAGRGLQNLDTLSEEFVIVEWLQSPENAADLLCDVFGWLRGRLDEDEGPLLYVNRPLGKTGDPDQVSSVAVEAKFGPDGSFTQLALGELIAASPLLPDVFRKANGRAVSDTKFIKILKDIFRWEDA
ncbi:hypothetical protein [Phaeobacter gallaeciensis]|uniref:hypothetical protein n=1 Tax=Phaeobacter gallaeciensis TaxID=60890 RepID=UPI00237F0FB0|nr:hypothetical protein [Phaeobacter gallaeciensis]MDE4099385.1 hypothetical protein [Phaeobacter gallaeciensis]MDE4108204.1 hypothetical protein [Phaeobacter gallaeciensis]MDE4112644.1 hypothetical protein [Phaeobacter gallaeciensis]MDE4117111.1 hypothetical protein [Phaeobacter gallaeciensis]MDE4121558.1 hypothetical protein [Phaeobacter gallaeciensis]